MKSKAVKNIARILLGSALMFAGVSHLTFARKPFQAQVPDWVPLQKDTTVVYSGIVEIALGSALVLVNGSYQGVIGILLLLSSSPFFQEISRSMSTSEMLLVWTRMRND